MIKRLPPIKLLSVDNIVLINQKLGQREQIEYACLDRSRVESAVHAAFYPGTYPFVNGGIAEVAGALCYFIVMSHAFSDGNKRTGAIAATAFLAINGFELKFPFNKQKNINSFAEQILRCASGKATKDEMRKWFEEHKIKIDNPTRS